MAEKGSEVEELERMFTNESTQPVQISYSVIESITKKFCQMIGHGGFGIVYLGALRNDVMIAVKQLHHSQDLSDTQFMAEVKCLTGVNHKNIVRFLGYCASTQEVVMKVEGKDRMVINERKRFLCYEYVPNGNLHDYLQEKTHGYQWSIRYRIMKGICQGLHYLHGKRINHLDLKPANVMLGAQMEPKITDFGLSRRNDGTQSIIVDTNVKGTLGYMAPEYIHEKKISSKADIYSLGIIMDNLLTWSSNENITENWHELLNVLERQQMERCIEIAQKCADNDPNKRPAISDIICMLTETESSIQIVPPVIIPEPRNDPTSMLFKNVNMFLARRSETHRGPKKVPERPKWKLVFWYPPKLPIISGKNIKDTHGDPLEVILLDADTDKPSTLQKVLQIELVPLLGNFPRDCWDDDDFQKGVVEDLEGKRPLLGGECRLITMWNGRATVNELMFTDDSLNCGCMFRIGVRVVPGTYRGPRILEAMTEAFMVREVPKWGVYTKPYDWQLAFQCQPRQPIYPESKVVDIIGNPLEIILVDMETGSPSALPKTMEELNIELVTLFAEQGGKMQSAESFWRDTVKPRNGNGPLLSGDINLTMKDDGRVIVNELQFTGPSYWKKKSGNMVRIGVHVVPGSNHGPDKIVVGMTKPFVVQDTQNDKRFPPGLTDEVWRLKHISWGGLFHERLTQNKVMNVQDFLRMQAVKPEELRAIMGDGMEDSTWEEIIRHARTCVFPIDKVYKSMEGYPTIYVNSIFDLVKAKFSFMEGPLQHLSEDGKRLVQEQIRSSYMLLQEVQQTWKLAFKSQPRLKIDAGSCIVDATGNPLEIILLDAKTGLHSALPMELHIQLVPLLGDFPPFEDWSAEDFRMAIVKQRKKNVPQLLSHLDPVKENEPLLKGHERVTMRNGRVTVKELQFTDDSSWVRSGKFRIGACVVPGGSYDGSCRIFEAVTEAFEVEDLNQKHYPPVLSDHIWRLVTIDKGGELQMELMRNKVDTVQEFLRMLNVKVYELCAIFEDDDDYDNDNVIRRNVWLYAVVHAKTCVRDDKVYRYSGANGTVYVDSIFRRLFKVEIDDEEVLLHQLDPAEMRFVRQLILEAYENRRNLQEVSAAMELRENVTIKISRLLHSLEEYDYNEFKDDDDDDDQPW